MSYAVTHRDGWEEEGPPISQLPALLDELSEHPEDPEHGSIAVLYESSALERKPSARHAVHDRAGGPHRPGGAIA